MPAPVQESRHANKIIGKNRMETILGNVRFRSKTGGAVHAWRILSCETDKPMKAAELARHLRRV